MNKLHVATLLAAVACVCGCAAFHNQLALDPVGPQPGTAGDGSSAGTLLVFSAFETTADFNRSPYRRQYTDYRVESADGTRLIRTVHNDNGLLFEGPKKIELPVGNYRVLARANGYGCVTVPVVVRSGQTTSVHLEGSAWWPKSSTIFQSNPVRLPSGQIVGWRASL
jgi:hypothetical protein